MSNKDPFLDTVLKFVTAGMALAALPTIIGGTFHVAGAVKEAAVAGLGITR